jgi:hypothetical protein
MPSWRDGLSEHEPRSIWKETDCTNFGVRILGVVGVVRINAEEAYHKFAEYCALEVVDYWDPGWGVVEYLNTRDPKHRISIRQHDDMYNYIGSETAWFSYRATVAAFKYVVDWSSDRTQNLDWPHDLWLDLPIFTFAREAHEYSMRARVSKKMDDFFDNDAAEYSSAAMTDISLRIESEVLGRHTNKINELLLQEVCKDAPSNINDLLGWLRVVVHECPVKAYAWYRTHKKDHLPIAQQYVRSHLDIDVSPLMPLMITG